MARGEAAHDRGVGGQRNAGAHLAGSQARYDGPDTAAYGWNESEIDETQEEYEKRISGYAEAVRYFIDHQEAPLHPIARAYVESMRDEMESSNAGGRQKSALN